MKMKRLFLFIFLTILGCNGGGSSSELQNVQDSVSVPSETVIVEPLHAEVYVPDLDTLNRIRSQQDVSEIRADILTHIWGTPALPHWFPDMIEANVEDEYLGTVTRLTVDMGDGINSIAYLIEPENGNGELFIYHQGHGGDFRISGHDTITTLLDRGYSVLAFAMPLLGMNSCPFETPDHNQCEMRHFVEPIAVCLNYLGVDSASMIGISGGGWTTTIYAAIDARIKNSYPVAGSYPFYLREALGIIGDWEQNRENPLYDHVSYIELYIMATDGGRNCLQAFNEFDSCCFWDRYSDTYKDYVKNWADILGGSFDVLIDDTHREHIISDYALGVILDH